MNITWMLSLLSHDLKPVFEKTISQVRAEERWRKHPSVFVEFFSAACARHKGDWRVGGV